MEGLAEHAGADRLSPRRVVFLVSFACLAAFAAQGFTPPAADRNVTQGSADSLVLELVMPPRVRVRERVPIKLVVLNRGGRPVDLYLRGRTATFDVVVSDSAGTVVWTRLEGEVIPAIVHLRTLAPAEGMELDAAWDQRTRAGARIDPGSYGVRGLLLTEGQPMETRQVRLQIAPG